MNRQDSGTLIRTVGFPGLVAMCVNSVVGSGIFLLPAESYKPLVRFRFGHHSFCGANMHSRALLRRSGEPF